MRRPAGLAGTWYPADPGRLRAAVDGYLAEADGRDAPAGPAQPVALVAPHAGLVYSGPVAASAYRLLGGHAFDVAVLVGPSHHVAFEGVAVWPSGAFESPLGALPVDAGLAADLAAALDLVHERPAAHVPEHALELQLPFLARVCPGLPILPLIMGNQSRGTAMALGRALAAVTAGRRALFVASSDLSHFHPRPVAAALDREVVRLVDRFDAEGLMRLLEREPGHACGGGPIVSALLAARLAGATAARTLAYGDSGDISGDTDSVVGYMAGVAAAGG
ncbi:MAG: AmmeMemoRadiSam system protein B [Vicinamibacterales bacterium]